MPHPRPTRRRAAQEDDDRLTSALRAAFRRAQDPLAPHAIRQLHRTLRRFVSAQCAEGWDDDEIVAAVLRVGAADGPRLRIVEEDGGDDGFTALVLQSAVLHTRLCLKLHRRSAEAALDCE